MSTIPDFRMEGRRRPATFEGGGRRDQHADERAYGGSDRRMIPFQFTGLLTNVRRWA
jgi:hypothetical protein